MSKYNVRVFWEMSATVTVEADSLEEAIENVQMDNGPLPENGDYVEGSWEVDEESTEMIND